LLLVAVAVADRSRQVVLNLLVVVVARVDC
jgi:hypothetical protein